MSATALLNAGAVSAAIEGRRRHQVVSLIGVHPMR
jgi:hypothetical protein